MFNKITYKNGFTRNILGRCYQNEAKIISDLIGFDREKAFSEAVEALPDPKSWEKFEENQAGEKAA